MLLLPSAGTENLISGLEVEKFRFELKTNVFESCWKLPPKSSWLKRSQQSGKIMSQWLKEISASGLFKQKFVYRVVLQINPRPSLPWWPQYLTSSPLASFRIHCGAALKLVTGRFEWERAGDGSSWEEKYSNARNEEKLHLCHPRNVNCTWTLTHPPNHFNLRTISNLHFTAPASMTFLMHEHNFEWKFMQK